ncbi:hypothetical protein SSX86_015009 [Deinandra increscens subsp. villosa]|uniref:Pentatricopeptide repeat-containing protein n=1 Tax=Deinandra increscens subsp. villosa TaxID=3103831 RepID=A0AAP0GW75_9ASTR
MIRWAGKTVLRKSSSKTILKLASFSFTKLHIISSNVSPRFSHGARHLFDEMPQRAQVGFFDVLDLVEHCKVRPSLQNVVNVHALALKVGVLAHLPASTSLVMAYSRAGDYSSSVAVFDEVSCKDVVIWNAMITSALENGMCRDAVSFFVQILQEGIKFDSLTLVIAVSAVSRVANRLPYLQVVHGLGVRKGLLSD